MRRPSPSKQNCRPAPSDVIRPFILHAFGGLYLDLDSECLGDTGPALEGFDLVLMAEVGGWQRRPQLPHGCCGVGTRRCCPQLHVPHDWARARRRAVRTSFLQPPSPASKSHRDWNSCVRPPPFQDLRQLNNAQMASAPGHPLWLAFAREMAAKAEEGNTHPLEATGPALLTKAFIVSAFAWGPASGGRSASVVVWPAVLPWVREPA